jgi:hypothetical protein
MGVNTDDRLGGCFQFGHEEVLPMRAKSLIPILMVLAFAACPSKHENATATMDITTDTNTATHPASPGGPALVPETKVGSTVLVTLNDNLITVENPDDIPPGPAVLTVKNIGTQVHNLFIEGPGMNKAASDSFSPGKTVDVNVDFVPGIYTFYCPILDHRKKGEELKLMIKKPTAPAPSSITLPDTSTSTTGTTKSKTTS